MKKKRKKNWISVWSKWELFYVLRKSVIAIITEQKLFLLKIEFKALYVFSNFNTTLSSSQYMNNKRFNDWKMLSVLETFYITKMNFENWQFKLCVYECIDVSMSKSIKGNETRKSKLFLNIVIDIWCAWISKAFRSCLIWLDLLRWFTFVIFCFAFQLLFMLQYLDCRFIDGSREWGRD